MLMLNMSRDSLPWSMNSLGFSGEESGPSKERMKPPSNIDHLKVGTSPTERNVSSQA